MTSPLISIGGLFASALCVLTMVAVTAKPPATIPSTPMEAALDALRSRFPNQVVIGHLKGNYLVEGNHKNPLYAPRSIE